MSFPSSWRLSPRFCYAGRGRSGQLVKPDGKTRVRAEAHHYLAPIVTYFPDYFAGTGNIFTALPVIAEVAKRRQTLPSLDRRGIRAVRLPPRHFCGRGVYVCYGRSWR